MLEPRLYSDDPPPVRTFVQDNPTLLVSWWCTGFALTIILFRLAGRLVRTERLFREDKIMALAIIPLLARMALVHVVLLWGTNNVVTTSLTPEDVYHRQIGSGLVLASRIMYAAVLWVQKLTITEFFTRITNSFWKRSSELGISFLRWFLLATFTAVVIATLGECHPFDRYWQVIPDPGPQCRQAYAQLLTMGAANVLTDLLLIGFPIPIILRSAMKLMRKFELILLFALSIVPIIITLIRIPSIIGYQGRQQSRTLWASIEILFATACTNALVLGSFVRDRGPKKQRFKFGSASDSLSRPSTRRDLGRTDTNWGSDEDLVRGMGLNLQPELRDPEKMAQAARPAPVALPGRSRSQSSPPINMVIPAWRFPTDEKIPGDLDEIRAIGGDRSPGEVTLMTPRKVSFFDVGGLLDDGTRRQSGSTLQTMDPRFSIHSVDFAVPERCRLSSRQGSTALLHDVGGLLTTPEGASESDVPCSSSATSDTYVATEARAIISALRIPPSARQQAQINAQTATRQGRVQSLQDVGGLLDTVGEIPTHASSHHDDLGSSLQDLQDVGGLLEPDGDAEISPTCPPTNRRSSVPVTDIGPIQDSTSNIPVDAPMDVSDEGVIRTDHQQQHSPR
ncbi:MAG: hypothetical protein M1838_001887 [Thelocarpon superellum]|nr:MAG: hypothetical protein M1838_001887 [Thelocarpon superellum]